MQKIVDKAVGTMHGSGGSNAGVGGDATSKPGDVNAPGSTDGQSGGQAGGQSGGQMGSVNNSEFWVWDGGRVNGPLVGID